MSTASTSGSNARAPTKSELGRIAGALLTDEGLVEKDWYVVQALSALVQLRWEGNTRLVFCGGTSLSKGWGLISRFSEDIDFRLWHDDEIIPRPLCRKVRDSVMEVLSSAGFVELTEVRKVRDGSKFVEMHFQYGGTAPLPSGLRKEIKIELTMDRPRLSPVARAVTSFVAESRKQKAEVSSILCLDPVEIAAEKLSAFSWRALNRTRGSDEDDPSIVRHLYDLASLHTRASQSWPFRALALEVIRADAARGKADRPTEPAALISKLLAVVEGNTLWKTEYDTYIHEVGFGSRENLMSFDHAFQKLRLYAEMFPGKT